MNGETESGKRGLVVAVGGSRVQAVFMLVSFVLSVYSCERGQPAAGLTHRNTRSPGCADTALLQGMPRPRYRQNGVALHSFNPPVAAALNGKAETDQAMRSAPRAHLPETTECPA